METLSSKYNCDKSEIDYIKQQNNYFKTINWSGALEMIAWIFLYYIIFIYLTINYHLITGMCAVNNFLWIETILEYIVKNVQTNSNGIIE